MKLRLTVLAIWLAGIFAAVCLNYPVFKLREVVVQGNHAESTEKIASLLDAAAGENIFAVDLHSWVSRIVASPAVERARAYVTLTGKAVVKVEETAPQFLLDTRPISGLSANREVLPLRQHPIVDRVPLISGVGGEPDYYSVSDDPRVLTAMRFYTRWLEYCGDYNDRLAEIHVTPDFEIGVYLWPDRRYVTLGRGNWDDKLVNLWRLLKRLPRGVAPLDMRFARQVIERS